MKLSIYKNMIASIRLYIAAAFPYYSEFGAVYKFVKGILIFFIDAFYLLPISSDGQRLTTKGLQ